MKALFMPALALSLAPGLHSHPAPAMAVEIHFADAQGRPLPDSATGLSVRLIPATGALPGSALAAGATRVMLAAGHPLPDSVTLELRDPWQRPVAILDPEARDGRLRFAFPAAAQSRENPFPGGAPPAPEFLLDPRGLRSPGGGAAKAFRLDWPPPDSSAAEAREWKAAEAIDRKNAEDLRKRMAALRAKGWVP